MCCANAFLVCRHHGSVRCLFDRAGNSASFLVFASSCHVYSRLFPLRKHVHSLLLLATHFPVFRVPVQQQIAQRERFVTGRRVTIGPMAHAFCKKGRHRHLGRWSLQARMQEMIRLDKRGDSARCSWGNARSAQSCGRFQTGSRHKKHISRPQR